MKADDFFQSKTFGGILLSIAGLIILVVVFKFGVFVGMRKASFSFKWADQYHRNFAGPQEGFFGDYVHTQATNDDSVFGKIIKVTFSQDQTKPSQISVNGSDNVEKVILVDETTVIRRQMKNITLSDLNVSDTIVVIGEPNDLGQIQAKLIRVMSMPLNSAPIKKTSCVFPLQQEQPQQYN